MLQNELTVLLSPAATTLRVNRAVADCACEIALSRDSHACCIWPENDLDRHNHARPCDNGIGSAEAASSIMNIHARSARAGCLFSVRGLIGSPVIIASGLELNVQFQTLDSQIRWPTSGRLLLALHAFLHDCNMHFTGYVYCLFDASLRMPELISEYIGVLIKLIKLSA